MQSGKQSELACRCKSAAYWVVLVALLAIGIGLMISRRFNPPGNDNVTHRKPGDDIAPTSIETDTEHILTVAPDRFTLSTASTGQLTRYAIVRSLNTNEFRILRVTPPSPEIQISLTRFGGTFPGYRLELYPITATLSLHGKAVTIETDVAEQKEIKIPFYVMTNSIIRANPAERTPF